MSNYGYHLTPSIKYFALIRYVQVNNKKTSVGAAFSRELKRSRLEAAPTKYNTACYLQITGKYFLELVAYLQSSFVIPTP